MIKPRTQVPPLDVRLVGGGRFHLAGAAPDYMTMLVFYRGHHCPICKKNLKQLQTQLAAFQALGIQVVAISTNSQQLADKTRQDWGLDDVTLGYGLTIEKAREWGLFISEGISDSEPAEFSEPGLFLVLPDGMLYAASIQTMPFTRPDFEELLGGLTFVKNKNYPARGEA
ncbi:peroxiredoxin-like family protein [Hymenobacter rubripertinctus]|uniref:AhpC/TSA family protein n=1 Tax=Hymenobacter rubripertinctus TaxID=2029981 RepID=A0A418R052_9BACT|nr:peroxiredoxin-like family protein [Hymenobacter rubripertinctus]RIY10830.1 AhpC/TSA family protein [Hymenobacter rubripertinctus]